MTHENFVATDQ